MKKRSPAYTSKSADAKPAEFEAGAVPANELERELAHARAQPAVAVEIRNDLELQLKKIAQENSVLRRIIDANPCVTIS